MKKGMSGMENIWKMDRKQKPFFTVPNQETKVQIEKAVSQEVAASCVTSLVDGIRDLSSAVVKSLVGRNNGG